MSTLDIKPSYLSSIKNFSKQESTSYEPIKTKEIISSYIAKAERRSHDAKYLEQRKIALQKNNQLQTKIASILNKKHSNTLIAKIISIFSKNYHKNKIKKEIEKTIVKYLQQPSTKKNSIDKILDLEIASSYLKDRGIEVILDQSIKNILVAQFVKEASYKLIVAKDFNDCLKIHKETNCFFEQLTKIVALDCNIVIHRNEILNKAQNKIFSIILTTIKEIAYATNNIKDNLSNLTKALNELIDADLITDINLIDNNNTIEIATIILSLINSELDRIEAIDNTDILIKEHAFKAVEKYYREEIKPIFKKLSVADIDEVIEIDQRMLDLKQSNFTLSVNLTDHMQKTKKLRKQLITHLEDSKKNTFYKAINDFLIKIKIVNKTKLNDQQFFDKKLEYCNSIKILNNLKNSRGDTIAKILKNESKALGKYKSDII